MTSAPVVAKILQKKKLIAFPNSQSFKVSGGQKIVKEGDMSKKKMRVTDLFKAQNPDKYVVFN